jgi:hypothetical protein
VPSDLKRLGYGDVEKRKEELAKDIQTDEKPGDFSKRILRPDVWASYWEAFEEPLDACA